MLADSASDRELMSKAAHFLDGQILRSVNYLPDTERCQFRFDLGGIVETWLDSSDPSEQWLLYHGEDDVCVLNAENEIEFSPYHGSSSGGE